MRANTLTLTALDEEDFILLGIVTDLEGYKLAYLLNQELNTQFKRKYIYDKEEKTKVKFIFYEYSEDFDWILFPNLKIEEASLQKLTLFGETTNFVIPEHETVNYFIKILEEESETIINKIIVKVQEIIAIDSCFEIDIKTIKSTGFLII